MHACSWGQQKLSQSPNNAVAVRPRLYCSDNGLIRETCCGGGGGKERTPKIRLMRGKEEKRAPAPGQCL